MMGDKLSIVVPMMAAVTFMVLVDLLVVFLLGLAIFLISLLQLLAVVLAIVMRGAIPTVVNIMDYTSRRRGRRAMPCRVIHADSCTSKVHPKRHVSLSDH